MIDVIFNHNQSQEFFEVGPTNASKIPCQSRFTGLSSSLPGAVSILGDNKLWFLPSSEDVELTDCISKPQTLEPGLVIQTWNLFILALVRLRQEDLEFKASVDRLHSKILSPKQIISSSEGASRGWDSQDKGKGYFTIKAGASYINRRQLSLNSPKLSPLQQSTEHLHTECPGPEPR